MPALWWIGMAVGVVFTLAVFCVAWANDRRL